MNYGLGDYGPCGHGYTAPARRGIDPFVLIVVLFILLIIVGATIC
ncbi:YjcZ family sporulation protein [Virgibacillus byunsanensis]|uniref:YjcZ family sporulation protein n=1 Tax=Virgibacillus byunsanensis TaxID=570945 RepID=A0ABW3LTS4_9BACI